MKGNIPVIAGGKDIAYYHNVPNRDGNIITISASGAYAGFVNYFDRPIFASDCNTIKSKNEDNISTKLIYVLLQAIQSIIYKLQKGQAQPHVYGCDIANVKIPILPINIQKQIIKEIDEVENIITEANKVIEKSKEKIEELIELAQQKKSIIYRLSNNKAFSLTIGKRVLNSELIKNGTIPVYSANVNIPFGYVNNTILHDFSSPSVLWGIDGDWMVNYISSGIHFYPTDHCGVLRVLTHEISPKYLSFIFNKLGKQQGFCRKLRASIDRVSGLSVELPNYAIQVETASQIEQLELKIIKARDSIEDAINKKQIIIEKYLQNER